MSSLVFSFGRCQTQDFADPRLEAVQAEQGLPPLMPVFPREESLPSANLFA